MPKMLKKFNGMIVECTPAKPDWLGRGGFIAKVVKPEFQMQRGCLRRTSPRTGTVVSALGWSVELASSLEDATE